MQYKNNQFKVMTLISQADTILTLNSDIDTTFIGVLTLSNNTTKTMTFIKEHNIYKTRLLLTEEDLPYLTKCRMYLTLIDGNTQKQSNTIDVKFDIPKIKKTVKQS